VNDPVLPLRRQLTVELGPGLLNSVFDGAQRSLPVPYVIKFIITERERETQQTFMKSIAQLHDLFVPHGGNSGGALDKSKKWFFQPLQRLRVGDHLGEGDIYGAVEETRLLPIHSIMVPPKVKGTITYIAPAGDYTVRDTVLELEIGGQKKRFGMMQTWPVRQPRPFTERLQCDRPLLMGLRMIDTLCPYVGEEMRYESPSYLRLLGAFLEEQSQCLERLVAAK